MPPEQNEAVVFEEERFDPARLRICAQNAQSTLVRAVMATGAAKTPEQAKLALLVFALIAIGVSAYFIFTGNEVEPLPFDQEFIEREDL